jgi:hypothetical protein
MLKMSSPLAKNNNPEGVGSINSGFDAIYKLVETETVDISPHFDSRSLASFETHRGKSSYLPQPYQVRRH